MKCRVPFAKIWFVAAVLWVFSILAAVSFTRKVFAKDALDDDYSSLRLFTDVLFMVQKNYYKDVDVKSLVDGAVKGMVAALDPHSSYLPSDVYKELQVETKGEFGGLGIEISVKDGLLTVVSPLEDSPAARVGIMAGDQIIKINDEFTKDVSLVDAVKKMRGVRGTTVTIAVHRDAYPDLIPFTVVRDIIKVKSVRSRILTDGLAYIRLAQFQDDTLKEFIYNIDALKKKNTDRDLAGLILDLRNNPGGLLAQAISIVDVFLKDGIIVYTDGRLENQKHKYFAKDDRSEPNYPVIVLVNSGSASAAEIVAGALQDADKALIVGTRTFGKGSVQTIIPMEDSQSALRLTTALYYTKSGRSIQAQGVSPDVEVEAKKVSLNVEDLQSLESAVPREADLPGAIKNPLPDSHTKDGQVGSGSSVSSTRKNVIQDQIQIGSRAAIDADLSKLLESDSQLSEAINLLKKWITSGVKPSVIKTKIDS